MLKISSRYRYSFGIVLLFGVVFLWVGSNFLVSNIFSEGKFDRAFFLTYFNTGTFSLYLIIAFFQKTFFQKAKCLDNKKNDVENQIEIEFGEPSNSSLTVPLLKGKETEELTVKETAKLSLVFCLLWFIANWFNNACFSYTSVASGTILSSTSGIFTLGLGAIFKVEKITFWKLVGITISFGGVCLIGASDLKKSSLNLSTFSIIIGDLLSLSGAFFYGCYTTFLKYKVGDENRMNMQLFLGFVGLINLILLFPMFFVLHYTGIEPFMLPPTHEVWYMLLFNAFVGAFISDLMWVYAVVMTSPLVVTLGLSLTNPLALIGEVLIKHSYVSPLYISGACLVVVGFLVVNRESFKEQTQP